LFKKPKMAAYILVPYTFSGRFAIITSLCIKLPIHPAATSTSPALWLIRRRIHYATSPAIHHNNRRRSLRQSALSPLTLLLPLFPFLPLPHRLNHGQFPSRHTS
jgi:hypothetical protein